MAIAITFTVGVIGLSFYEQTTLYPTNIMPKRFVSYLRVSTTRQGVSGLGLEAQRKSVAEYVLSVGGELLDEVVEVESGSLNDRPGLKSALAHCKRRGACLVVAKLDRLARNVAFVSALMETGAEFVAVDAPFANRLFVHILSAFAEHEREMISVRTKAALAAAKARGVRLGVNGAVLSRQRKTEADEFAQVVRPHFEMVRSGGARTLQDMATGLDAMGIKTREGAAWTPTAVSRVLVRLAG